MCLWLLTACLGLMPASQSPIVVVPAVPAPILQPTTTTSTTTTTTTTTTFRPPTLPPMNVTLPPNTTFPTPGGELSPLILCNDPDIVCIINPDEIIAGSLPIDPRLGTTPATSAAFQVLPVTGYSARIPSYDETVRFPREKRSVDGHKEMNIKEFLLSISNDNEHRIRKRDTCRCVARGTCPTTTTTNNGAGLIDVRIVTPGAVCAADQEYCCTPDGTGTGTTIACGTRQTVSTAGTNPAQGQANFGEFPWQAMVLTRQNDYLAGGLLIDSRNVLTVTHRLTNYIVSGTAPNVKVRLGEWDAAGTYEPVPFQEYNVQRVFVHPNYVANTLQYDITVLRLATAVPFTPAAGSAGTINRVCLPPPTTSAYNGMRCMVAGWGKNQFGVQGQYQQILKKVEVPIVAPSTCQSQLQAARLGASYVLDTTSFVCAGGEANRDSCTGDGGSGLVCQVNGQWVAVGLVAWGLGCATANVPGVYVNIAGLLPWIQQQVATA